MTHSPLPCPVGVKRPNLYQHRAAMRKPSWAHQRSASFSAATRVPRTCGACSRATPARSAPLSACPKAAFKRTADAQAAVGRLQVAVVPYAYALCAQRQQHLPGAPGGAACGGEGAGECSEGRCASQTRQADHGSSSLAGRRRGLHHQVRHRDGQRQAGARHADARTAAAGAARADVRPGERGVARL